MDSLLKLHDAQELIPMLLTYGPILGYVLLFTIVFAETGLLIGFFLPGDSLLFLAGAAAAQEQTGLNIGVMVILLCIAAIAGDAVGFAIGRKVGTSLYNKPDSRLFKKQHLERTHAFYEKHGPKTIVLARFVPIVRTFAPTVAGIAGMDYKKFALYNICGGIGWVCSMTLLGYFLGRLPWVKDNLEKAVLLIVFLSILPMIVHFIQDRRHNKKPVEAAIDTIAPGLEAGD